MATYVNNLRLKEIATGDESGTWGTSTNTNLELVGEALGFGTEAITTNANTHASTVADGSADEARAMYIKYTGNLDSDCTITIGPNTLKRVHIVENATGDSGSSGPYNIIIKQGTGATVTVANGQAAMLYLDGAGSGAAVVDALTDLQVSNSMQITGTTPTLTLGDGGEEDVKIQYNGVKDFYIANDDSADKLVIGEGSTVGTNSILTITDDTVTLGDGAEVDTALVYDGNAKDFYIGLDDSADKFVVGVGSTVGTNNILTLDDDSVTIGDGAAVDTKIVFDGNAQDFYVGLDDSADDLLIGNGSTVGSNVAIGINASQVVQFNGAYTFPTSDGSSNQVLQTNGSGALSFATVSGGVSGISSSADATALTIDSSERLFVNNQLTVGDSSVLSLGIIGVKFNGTTNNGVVCETTRDATGSTFIRFNDSDSNAIGSISQDGASSTAFSTSSDYRLKENVSYSFDATTRLNQLKPCRFNFIADASRTVDGFLAHEVSSIVPEAIVGDKDAVNDDGSVKPQGIDQSKLVPLLVKAVQELAARVTTLEG